MNAARQSKEIASRNHIRHALAVERARAMVAMIGKLADQVWAKVSKQIDDGSLKPAEAVDAFRRELPRVMEKAFKDHARWAWERTLEVWTVLTPWQRERVARRMMRESLEGAGQIPKWDSGGSHFIVALREDDLKNNQPGDFTSEGDKIKVFRAPSESKVNAWVNNGGWFQGQDRTWKDRLEALSHKIADKDALKSTLTRMYADGATPDQIRRAIQPSVEGLKVSAQRIARTESLRIAEEAQREGYRQVDDLIVGIQIWATLDDRTRPEHAARNGRIYPKDAAPLVPDEPNCRCFSSPVLRDEADVVKADVGGRPAGNLTVVDGTVQDLETWSNWFDAQSPARQRGVLGPDRWEALTAKVDGPIRWAHAVDDSGYMSSVEQIKAADAKALQARASAVRGGVPKSIADESPVVKPDIPGNSPLGRLLGREGAGGEPIGVQVDAVNRARTGGLARPTTPNVVIQAQPNLRGLNPARVPELVNRASVVFQDTKQGRQVAGVLRRMTPKQLGTRAGAEKMTRIVEHPAAQTDAATRAFWRVRAKGGSLADAAKAARDADLVTVAKPVRGPRGERIPARP
ncbi:MAG: minor capsid protein [Phycisphaeraceae bacterium]|nr:minor capsid protein [Phycisphaeraceae bacterium]